MDSSPSINSATATTPMKFCKVSQVQVIFRGVEETYPVGVDIHCNYSVNGSLDVGSRDWVGLYRVGWRSQSDYIYYDWALLPQDYVKGKDFEGKIIFPAHKLPKDDGEFYQFCYVASAGQVRGASTPFQFRQTSLDDLIEIEDENGELLVIKTKSALLEEKLKKANELKMSMRQQIQVLENERNLLLATEIQLQKKLKQQKEEGEILHGKLQESNELMNEQRLQLEHLQVYMNSFQEKMEVLNQEKATMEKRLDENDAYIVSLQEKIKALVNEKDALTGRVRALEDEGEQLRGFVVENDRFKTRLMEEEILSARMKKEVERMEEEMKEQQVRLEKQLQVSTSDKETIEFLFERIRNAEDKLGAAEHCKMMLNEEVLTTRQAFEKMSSKLEETELAMDSIRKCRVSAQQTLSAKIECLCEEKRDVQEKLDFVTKEKDELSERMTELQEHLREKVLKQRSEAEGSLYALEMAHNTLKERYTRMTKKFEANQRTLEHTLCHMRELEMGLEDEKTEVEQLKERLRMAEEAYKEKYVECEILENQLIKQQRRIALKLDKDASDRNAVLFPSKSESPEMAPGSESKELVYIKAAFQRSLDKAEKYKKMYIEQKLLNDKLVKKLHEKDGDIDQTKEIWIKPRGPPSVSDSRACDLSPDFHIPASQKSFTDTPLMPARSLESFDALDGPGMGGVMQAPLRPLPAPMLPAKVGNVSPTASGFPPVHDGVVWVFRGMSDFEADDVGSSELEDLNLSNHSAAAAAANIDGERYEDAPGEPQRTCPICNFIFSYDVTERQILSHVDMHYGPVCPICSEHYGENYPMIEFEKHVNSHFE